MVEKGSKNACDNGASHLFKGNSSIGNTANLMLVKTPTTEVGAQARCLRQLIITNRHCEEFAREANDVAIPCKFNLLSWR